MPNLILEAKVCNVVIQDPFPAETTLPANQRFPDGSKVFKVIKQGADNIR